MTTPFGIVCRREMVYRMERLVGDVSMEIADPLTHELCRVPVYTKDDQAEPYRLFYDHDELRAYLKEEA